MLAYGIDHFTMNTHLSLLVTLTWLRIIDNSLWTTFDNLDLSLVTFRRDHLWKILTIWLQICALYLHENNIILKYRNTFVTVTNDRKEGKSGLLLANNINWSRVILIPMAYDNLKIQSHENLMISCVLTMMDNTHENLTISFANWSLQFLA